MLNNKSANSRKANAKLMFEGGTSLEWNMFKPRLFAELRAKQAFEFIDLTIPGAIDADGLTVERIPDFGRPCPVGGEAAHVQAELDIQIQVVNNSTAASTALWMGAVMPVAARNVEIAKIQVQANHDIARIENTRGSIVKTLDDSVARYEKRQENFDLRKAEAVNVFYSMLGSGPLAIAEGYLRDGRPRAAFRALDVHFSAGVGGQIAAATILSQIQNYTVDLSAGSMNEHMIDIQRLAHEYEGGGLNNALGVNFLLHIFLASLEKGTDQFKDEILFIRHNNLSWEAAALKLQEREANLTVEKRIGSSKGKSGKVQALDTEQLYSMLTKLVKRPRGKRARSEKVAAATVAAAQEGPKKRALQTCSTCNKPGHTSDMCWSNMICPQCKQKGHILRRCPEMTGKSSYTSKKPFKVSELLPK